MRIYITGISGLIGSALEYYLKRLGHIVMGCDASPHTLFDIVDVRDGEALHNSVVAAAPDIVFHCAAMLGVQNTESNPDICMRINADGTRNAIAAAKAAKAKTFVLCSSSEVYGNQTEELSELGPLLGDNVYAASKRIAEHLVEKATKGSQMGFVVARLFNCYGPFQVKQFFIPKAIDRIIKNETVYLFGDPNNSRSYLHAGDAAYYLFELARKAQSGKVLTVNVAHPEQVSLGQVCDLLGKIIAKPFAVVVQTKDYEDRAVSRDIPIRKASVAKLNKLVKFVPTPLEHGLRMTVKLSATLLDDWSYEKVFNQ